MKVGWGGGILGGRLEEILISHSLKCLLWDTDESEIHFSCFRFGLKY